MESGAQPGRRSDSLRKRTLEERKNTGGDCVLLPAKHRESDEETEELVTNRASFHKRDSPLFSGSTGHNFSVAVDVKQFHQAPHDVEEHFRRSLESIQHKRPTQNAVSSSNVLKSTDHTNQVVSTDHDSHHITVTENNTHTVLTTPLITSKSSSTVAAIISSSSSSSIPSSSTSTSTSTTGLAVPQNIQYYLNSTTGTLFAASVPSTRLPTASVASMQVPPLIFGLPSGLQQPVSMAQTIGQPSVGAIKMSTQKPVTANPDTQQQLLAVAAAAGMTQPAGSILLPQLASSATANPSFIPIIDSNGVPQLMATSTPATSVAAATQAVNGAHTSNGGGGGSSSSSPVILLGPGNVPVVPPGFFFINPSDLSSVQTTSAVNAAAAGLVNFSNQSIRTSTSSPGYILIPPSTVQPPVNIGGLTQEQLLTLATLQQQQLQQQQQQVNATLSPTSSPRPPLTVGRPVAAHEPTAAVQNIMGGGGGSVEDHFARALGDQWVKVKQTSAPQQNKITA